MKRIILKQIACFLFVLFSVNIFSQQFLWSTKETTDTKYVPIENVTEEVMKFYDHYEFYFDGTGYSKAGFLKYFLKYDDKTQKSKDFRKMINEIVEPTIIAFKGNLGSGSTVLVMCITKDNVELVAFSNQYEENALNTYYGMKNERDKFERWLNSLFIQ